MLTAPILDAGRGPLIVSTSSFGSRVRAFGGAASAPASVAWPLANRAIAIPFELSGPFLASELFFLAGTSPGTTNFDLGIYDETFQKLASLGAVASTNTTDSIQPVGGGALATPLVLSRGRYYMAMSAAAITTTCRAITYANGLMRAWGLVQMAAAHPLPATFVPAAIATDIMPIIGVASINNLL